MLTLLLLLLTDTRAPRRPLPKIISQPGIVILKARRELRLFSGPTLLRTYRVGLGLNPVPPKTREGDYATPEGLYYVCLKNPRSKFTLSLGLSYPSPSDAVRGLRGGIITQDQHDAIAAAHRRKTTPPWNTPLGGEVFIHGRGSRSDWTWRCIALDDADIRELYRAIPLRTSVTIR